MGTWKKKIRDAWAYTQGNIRFKLYESTYFKWLLRTHIRQQIEYRMTQIKKECFVKGSCVHCGCAVPQLQMADKTCPGKCYPRMMGRSAWEFYRLRNNVKIK
jgi:hypothetical protein